MAGRVCALAGQEAGVKHLFSRILTEILSFLFLREMRSNTLTLSIIFFKKYLRVADT
jgi:hypothetical protein